MIEELKNLPDISFIDKMTIEDVQSFLISKYEQKYAELSERDSYSLPKASIYRIILNANAELIYQALQYIDRAGKQNMLKDTYGEYLDNLAALKGVKRNPAQAATVTMRFALESARGSATGIPAGTRVSDGGDVYFSVPEYTEIPPGASFVDCKVKCLTAGKSGNAIWDGVNKGRVYQAISPPTDAGIGVFGQIGTSGYYAGNSLVKMKLYELIGYDKVSGKEIYHAVPVLDSQGTPCLYDKVSGRFEYDMVGQEAFNYAV